VELERVEGSFTSSKARWVVQHFFFRKYLVAMRTPVHTLLLQNPSSENLWA